MSKSVSKFACEFACEFAYAARCIAIGLSPFAGIAFLLGLTPLAWSEAITLTLCLVLVLAITETLSGLLDDFAAYVTAFRRARRIARIRRERGIEYGH